jgi:hypothetical protein
MTTDAYILLLKSRAECGNGSFGAGAYMAKREARAHALIFFPRFQGLHKGWDRRLADRAEGHAGRYAHVGMLVRQRVDERWHSGLGFRADLTQDIRRFPANAAIGIL